MSRSIHGTRRHYWEESLWNYSAPETKECRLERLEHELSKKRALKEQVKGDRRRVTSEQPVSPEAIPIEVADQGDFIHYPASPIDIFEILQQLPVGVLDGLGSISLCLPHPESDDEWPNGECDPYIGRLTRQSVPGVYRGRCLGKYHRVTHEISLFGYVYPADLRDREMWEALLRLQTLSILVHEIAHHQDVLTRMTRGRWLGLDERKTERYALTTQAEWTSHIVVPYIESKYASSVRELLEWVNYHGGFSVSLELLAGPWGVTSGGKLQLQFFGSVSGALENLAKAVFSKETRDTTRTEFARDLLYGEQYAKAKSILHEVLKDAPRHGVARALLADISFHEGDLQQAEQLAFEVLEQDDGLADAWLVLLHVFEERNRWKDVVAIASKAVTAVTTIEDVPLILLIQAVALARLGEYANLEAHLADWPESGRNAWFYSLQALSCANTGRYQQALIVVEAAQQRFPRWLWRSDNSDCALILQAAGYHAAYCLGQTIVEHGLPSCTVQQIRDLGFVSWADRFLIETRLGEDLA